MLSAIEYRNRKTELARQVKEKRSAYEEASLAAIGDVSLAQQKDRLRTELRSLEEAETDLDAAYRAAHGQAVAADEARLIAARKDRYGATVARLGEVGDLAAEIDDTVDHLRALVERVKHVEDSWQRGVYELLPGDARQARDSIITTSMRGPLQQLEDCLRVLDARPRAAEVRAIAPRSSRIVARALQIEGSA